MTIAVTLVDSLNAGPGKMNLGQAWPMMKKVVDHTKSGSIMAGLAGLSSSTAKYSVLLPDVIPFDLSSATKAYHACKDTDTVKSLVQAYSPWTGSEDGLLSDVLYNQVAQSTIPTNESWKLSYLDGDQFQVKGADTGDVDVISTVDAGVLLVQAFLEDKVKIQIPDDQVLQIDTESEDDHLSNKYMYHAAHTKIRKPWQEVLVHHCQKFSIPIPVLDNHKAAASQKKTPVVVVTGSADDANRSQIRDAIESAGWKMGTNITKNTDLLLEGHNPGATKLNSAVDKGVRTIRFHSLNDVVNILQSQK